MSIAAPITGDNSQISPSPESMVSLQRDGGETVTRIPSGVLLRGQPREATAADLVALLETLIAIATRIAQQTPN